MLSHSGARLSHYAMRVPTAHDTGSTGARMGNTQQNEGRRLLKETLVTLLRPQCLGDPGSQRRVVEIRPGFIDTKGDSIRRARVSPLRARLRSAMWCVARITVLWTQATTGTESLETIIYKLTSADSGQVRAVGGEWWKVRHEPHATRRSTRHNLWADVPGLLLPSVPAATNRHMPGMRLPHRSTHYGTVQQGWSGSCLPNFLQNAACGQSSRTLWCAW
jgi:hypothetical protein